MMSLLLAKCLGSSMKQTIKVAIPSLKFDTYLNMHFRENDQIMVHDPQERCKPGDWILIRKLAENLSLQVAHKVEKVVYEQGNMVDPITGKKSIGYEFDEDVQKQANLFG